MATTIQIDEKLKKTLDRIKIHHRETYNDLILRLVGEYSPRKREKESLVETLEIMSDPLLMKSLANSIEEINKGKKGISWEEAKKELGLDV